MRDPERIDEFCNELAKMWKENCPDWRFGQLMTNFFSEEYYSKGRDPFFPEEEDIKKSLEKFFKKIKG